VSTLQSQIHVLVQQLDGGHARWWSEHDGVDPEPVATELRTPARRGAIWTARHWATDRARDLDVTPDALPVIALLTSELVGNAVVHSGGTHVEVRIRTDGMFLTVEVSDAGTDLPAPQPRPTEVPGGHGMRLVDMLAARWGTHAHLDGLKKTVWFSIPV
jgi:anti-sigma regulatory factor (Ser/Thr protein kinase)